MAYPFHPDADFELIPNSFNTAEDWGAVALQLEGYEDALRFCSPTHLTAWDPVRQRRAWRVEHTSQVPGGSLTTPGDLVFQGTGAGVYAAYDAFDGKRLWKSHTGVGVMAPPMSYRIAGEQYVAVLAGVGGSHGLHRDPLRYVNDGRLLAFKLGGAAAMPPIERVTQGRVDVPKLELSETKIARGRSLYGRHCGRCHGMVTRSTGVIPDLKYSTRSIHESWNAIVLGGILSGAGMASFSDVLDEPDAEAIHAYVVSRALHEPDVLQRLARWLGEYLCLPASWVAD